MISPAYTLGQLIDDPAALPDPRPPLIKRLCQRCELVLGWKVGAPHDAGTVTHGVCGPCKAIMLEEFDCWQQAVKREEQRGEAAVAMATGWGEGGLY